MTLPAPEPPFNVNAVGPCPRCGAEVWYPLDFRAVVRCLRCDFEVPRVVVVRAKQIVEQDAREVMGDG